MSPGVTSKAVFIASWSGVSRGSIVCSITNSILFPPEAENSHDQQGDRVSLHGREGSAGQGGKALEGKTGVCSQEAASWLTGVGGGDKGPG